MSTSTAQPELTPHTKTSLVGKLKVPAIILAVVALEWIMALMIMPSAAPTPPVASAMAAAEHGADQELPAEEPAQPADHGHGEKDAGHGGHGKEEAKDHGKHDAHGGHGGGHDAASTPLPRLSDAEEVDLGNFTVSGFQPASNSTLFVSFHLYGTVKHKYVGEFDRRMEENKHRIRDNIIVIIRSAELTDLTDAGLGLIKRRILETTNRTLGKPLLQEVVFSDFSFIEQ